MNRARTVLIVEDNERNLRLVRDVLEFSGFETVEARTGRDAIAMASDRRPDVILIDLQLPDMDGLTTLAGIRAQAPSAAIPAVALTAFAMKGDEERALAAGFDGYLTKPIDVRSFPEQIRRFCEGGDPP